MPKYYAMLCYANRGNPRTIIIGDIKFIGIVDMTYIGVLIHKLIQISSKATLAFSVLFSSSSAGSQQSTQ